MTTGQQQLWAELSRRLTAQGLEFDRLLSQADEVIVFGSWAAGVNSLHSDFDVLTIGSCRRLKGPTLDIVPVARDAVRDADWLESELATHVAQYGVWLRGDGGWRSSSVVRNAAALKKSHRVEALARSVNSSWEQLHRNFRQKYQTRLRRELQRLVLLSRGVPVQPTPVLDRASMYVSWPELAAEVGRSLTTSTAIEIISR